MAPPTPHTKNIKRFISQQGIINTFKKIFFYKYNILSKDLDTSIFITTVLNTLSESLSSYKIA